MHVNVTIAVAQAHSHSMSPCRGVVCDRLCGIYELGRNEYCRGTSGRVMCVYRSRPIVMPVR